MALSSRQKKNRLAEAEHEAQRWQQLQTKLLTDIEDQRLASLACDKEHRKVQGELVAATQTVARLASGNRKLRGDLQRARQEACTIKAELQAHEQETSKIQACSAELKKRIARLMLTHDQLMAAQAQMAPVAPQLAFPCDAEEDDYGRAGKPLAHLAKSAQLREGESQEAMRAEILVTIAETVEVERECKDWATKASAIRSETATLAVDHSTLGRLKEIVAVSAQKFEAENKILQKATEAAKYRFDAARTEHDRLLGAIHKAEDGISVQDKHMMALKFKLRSEVKGVVPTIKQSHKQARQAELLCTQKIAEIAKCGQLAHCERDARDRERRSRMAASVLLQQQIPPSKLAPHTSKLSESPGVAPSCFPTREASTPRSTIHPVSAGLTTPAPPTTIGLADRSGSSAVESCASSAAESFVQQNPSEPPPIREMRLPELRGNVRRPGSARLSHAGLSKPSSTSERCFFQL